MANDILQDLAAFFTWASVGSLLQPSAIFFCTVVMANTTGKYHKRISIFLPQCRIPESNNSQPPALTQRLYNRIGNFCLINQVASRYTRAPDFHWISCVISHTKCTSGYKLFRPFHLYLKRISITGRNLRIIIRREMKLQKRKRNL
jgi:hypothetical protein